MKSIITCCLTALMIMGCAGMNGLKIEPSSGPEGECMFTIVNQYDDDIAVKFFNVQDLNNHVHYIYVASARQATIRKMAPGNYIIRYSKGKEWDPKTKQFLIGRENYETDQKFVLEAKEYTEETAEGTRTVRQFSHQEFTLGSRSNDGTISTQKISDEEFQK
jgi:hypothetical protein